MSTKINMIMNTISKLLVVFTVFIFSSLSYSQNADPGIGILMSPASITQGSTGTLSATVGNYGNNTIVANSLRVTISVGTDAEILGIASGSDSRWTQLTLTTGSGNTIRLTNTLGGFSSFDVGDILLTVRGNVVSSADLILGNIVYITASNPLLCGVCPPIPLNASQGNASTSNDNSQTSLAVTIDSGDSDGDGDPNNTDPSPSNPCVFGSGQVLANATTTWNASDCDLDGNPNATDPHVLVPTAVNDALTAPFGQVSTVNILANDDFLANDGNTITQVSGGTAGGTVAFNPVTGIMSYTPLASESGTVVTVHYQVCQGTICSTAIVTITVPCTLVTPTLSIVNQPTCSSVNGTFTITNYNATYTYSVNPSNGVSITANTIIAPSGSYTVTAVSGTCSSLASLPIVLNAVNNSLCASIALIKTAHLEDLNQDGLAQVGENINYTFVVTNTGYVPLTNITISDPLPGIIMSGSPISLAVGGIDSTSFSGTYTITVQDVINGSVFNQATVYGTSPLGIIVQDLSDSNNNTGNSGTVLGIQGCKVEVFNAVTPNTDGNNDYLYIRGLDCYTDNSIEIFNRWGVLVYEIEGYDNNTRSFKGYSDGRVTIKQSEALPNGTYYYILKYKEFNGNVSTKTGFLYLTQ